ncbi:hypothetical protein DL96DRAFT_1714098 [Flagelloscypha sp. PMI_526]|nr:hypothetical protein DL96DRAFT_1714098 [Flagelloscypha sp. PMI_526]
MSTPLPFELYIAILQYASTPTLKQCSLTNKPLLQISQEFLFKWIHLTPNSYSYGSRPRFFLNYRNGKFASYIRELKLDAFTFSDPMYNPQSDFGRLIDNIAPHLHTLIVIRDGTGRLMDLERQSVFHSMLMTLLRSTPKLKNLVINDRLALPNLTTILKVLPELKYIETFVGDFERLATSGVSSNSSHNSFHICLNHIGWSNAVGSVPLGEVVEKIASFHPTSRSRTISLRIDDQSNLPTSFPFSLNVFEPFSNMLQYLHLPHRFSATVDAMTPLLPVSQFPVLAHLSFSLRALHGEDIRPFFSWLTRIFTPQQQSKTTIHISRLTFEITDWVHLPLLRYGATAWSNLDANQAYLPPRVVIKLVDKKRAGSALEEYRGLVEQLWRALPQMHQSGKLEIERRHIL